MLVSGVLGIGFDIIRPNGIPLVQDWDHHVESLAREAGIDIIPLRVALGVHSDALHLFVDARSKEKFDAGHIQNAISLPFSEIDKYMDVLEAVLFTEQTVVVYCSNRECDEALFLGKELLEMGQTNLLYYVDGFEVWEEFECPIQSN